ncbi:MAG: BlaI/MecI/CopY family transcriptional regulator [Verrucomicrobiales bacterium]|nr:BlaI/MecI/CopY family transcriptional regulator [Verrucomicrobiales bacterium]
MERTSKPTPHAPALSRRERQIMDVIYHREGASAAEVQASLPDAPSYSAVRTLLGILVQKGHLKVTPEGHRHRYLPAKSRRQAALSALKQVTEVFFGGSVGDAAAALLETGEAPLNHAEVAKLTALIDQARSREDANSELKGGGLQIFPTRPLTPWLAASGERGLLVANTPANLGLRRARAATTSSG